MTRSAMAKNLLRDTSLNPAPGEPSENDGTKLRGNPVPWIFTPTPSVVAVLNMVLMQMCIRDSVDAFWMDETEVTNSKYKQFVFWVRDSIIRERLADPAYGGNEEFKIEEDREGNPIKPHLNWNKPIPWRNANEDEQRAIESVYRINPITGVKELDPTQLRCV